MSVVLDALNKADKESHGSILRQNDDSEINEVKGFYKKFIGIVIVGNVFIFGALGAYIALNKADNQTIHMTEKITTEEVSPVHVVPVPIQPEAVLDNEESFEDAVSRNNLSIRNGPEIEIKGVFKDDSISYILIDDDMFKEGEKIKGVWIEKIEMKNIKFKYKGRMYDVPT